MRVFGHPRSGTHVLAATLHEHFFKDDTSFIKRVNAGHTGHWSRRSERAEFSFNGNVYDAVTVAPYGKLLGDHRAYPPVPIDGAIYIFRDGRDVALSFYNWSKMRRDDAMSFSEFIRAPLDWWGSPGTKRVRKKKRERYTFFEHWKIHVKGWTDSSAWSVRYETLVLRPKTVLDGFTARFGLPAPAEIRAIGPVGWNASKSVRIKRYETEMNDEDRAFFDSIVPVGFIGRWE